MHIHIHILYDLVRKAIKGQEKVLKEECALARKAQRYFIICIYIYIYICIYIFVYV